MLADTNIDIDYIPYTVPPGEEGVDFSHEGGEREAFEVLARQMADLSGCRYVDSCTHTDRIEVQNEHWGAQIEWLVNVYLDYRSQDGGDGMPIFLPSIKPILNGYCVSLKNIQLVDIFNKHVSLQPRPSHQYPNETLVYHGYLGCSLLFPTVTISIRTLTAFR
ncbi:hypothetical protein DEU56DRAFT_746730 [Suillus clintonianus]|uniref:uncharacterized protein n=1 Tax=Suillus clintonianus TaxID=1904413 RepID=UPI001B87234A|nr:uncharacterized protein DEU56DRAFT_746730 [Suillus clintonianus]KAG2121295.1 hypothetical protein DEU56DRAFT_746730 [Suillus clintonianus]